MSNSELRRIENLKRLLAPRHIAFIGGQDADYAARQCARRFKGTVSGVNPKRSEMGGQPCYPTVHDLPQVPDAVFLATPREAALQTVADLNGIGAGGVVCFTAGYGETGSVGRKSEQELIQAAGNMALVGPNCYGVINYVHDATLWPFGAGACKCRKGAALIMQSGMITADMAMNQRSVPLAYVISAGNQAMLAVEDYIDVLVDDPRVSGFGIYVEGIISIEKFAAACLKALYAGKPILLLKAGSSSIGANLAVSHTGSLSGADEAHQALFDLFGVIRVRSPELMLEALKFMTISGIPEGRRIAAFTCSGGEALMVADDLIHKTELNVVMLNLTSVESVRAAVEHIRGVIASRCLEQKSHGLLIESMVENAVHELLVGVQSDPQFGLTMVIASGGILVELYKDSQTVLLPTDAGTVIQALSRLKCHPLLCGYRGRAQCDIDKLVDTIMKIAEFAESNSGDLVEMDVNPLMVLPEGAIIADALIRMRR